MTSKPERIVVYRLGSLGDTVVALPSLHAVVRAFPDSERIVLTNFPINEKAAPLEAILGGSGLFHRFVEYPLGTRSVSQLLALRRSLRELGSTTLVYLTPPRGLPRLWRDLIFFRACGFKTIIGAPSSNDLQTNRLDAYGNIERECERIARTISSLETVDLTDPKGWDLCFNEAERAQAAGLLGPLHGAPRIVINMGGKAKENDWGPDRWATLVNGMAGKYADHALLFVGSVEDGPRASEIAALWPGTTLNLCGQTPPRISAAAMVGASTFIGHDSGPMHLAASVGVPCVSMFGERNLPRKWHPLGPQHRIIHDQRGVSAISVDQVSHAIDEVLGAGRAARPVRQAGMPA
jgi:heptosyltransferase-3